MSDLAVASSPAAPQIADAPGPESMLRITPLAAAKVNEIRDAEGIESAMALRLRVVGGGCAGFSYDLYSRLVERLSRKQLAVRSSSEGDRRYQTVELTAAGKRLVPVLAELADENDHEFFGHLKPNERSGLVSLLQDIVRRQGWKDLPVD